MDPVARLFLEQLFQLLDAKLYKKEKICTVTELHKLGGSSKSRDLIADNKYYHRK